MNARVITKTESAQAGYDRGLSGLAPDPEDERCRSGRFAYINGWSRGHREFLAAEPLKEFSFDFFLGGVPKERSLI
jgi:hypothetical protein